MSTYWQISPCEYSGLEKSFIHKSWLRSYRLSGQRGPISGATYYDAYSREIELLMKRPTVKAYTAHLPEARDQFFGFVVGEQRRETSMPIIHYAYVKQKARRNGIGTALIKAIGEGPYWNTYRTRDWDTYCFNKPVDSKTSLYWSRIPPTEAIDASSTPRSDFPRRADGLPIQR